MNARKSVSQKQDCVKLAQSCFYIAMPVKQTIPCHIFCDTELFKEAGRLSTVLVSG